MVMSSLVDLAQLHPIINFCIEKFNSIGRTTDLFPRSGNKDISVADLTARVTMSGVLHPFHFFEFEVVVDSGLVRNELFAHEHTVGERLVVTATKHEDTWVLKTNLDHLEIVWEVSSVFDVLMGEILSLSIENGDGL